MQQLFRRSWARACALSGPALCLTIFVSLVGLVGLVGKVDKASARDDLVLESLLRDCQDYRVRVRAAEALGRMQNAASSGALAAALIDKHPAVRAAAASALGQLGAMDALPALRRSMRDPVPAVVKSARTSIAQIELDMKRRGIAPSEARVVKYGVYIGELRDRSPAPDKGMLPALASSLGDELRAVDGAQLIESQAEAGGVPVYRVDGSIMDTDRALYEDKVTAHASVALLLTDDANQTLRIVFKGAATTIEDLDHNGRDQPERVAQLAMARAVRAALRNASSAMNETLRTHVAHPRVVQPTAVSQRAPMSAGEY